ncbi:MAG: hypothetical protein ACRDWT_16085, partial [Jatrophihabitantaceae bacterium]
MSGGVIVRGGADGIQAEIEDMLNARRMFSAAADQLDDVIGICCWKQVALAGAAASGDIWGELAARDALDSAVASLRGLNGELRGLTALLSMAIASYRDTDNSVLDLIG